MSGITGIGCNAFVIPPPPDVSGSAPWCPIEIATASNALDAEHFAEQGRVHQSRSRQSDRPRFPPPREIGGVQPQETIIHQDPKKAIAYWTREALAYAAKAISVDDVTGPSPTQFHDLGLTYPAYDSYQSDYLPAGTDYDASIGRIYLNTGNGLLGFCTGTVVARNLVLTAADSRYGIRAHALPPRT